MRTVMLGGAAAILLGSGVALSLQAIRAPSEPLQAIREPSPEVVARELLARELSEATAASPADAVAATPMTFRQVRRVPMVIESAVTPNAPEAAPAETRSTDEVETALRMEDEQDRAGSESDAELASTPPTITPRPQKQAANVSSSSRPSAKRSHARRRYVALVSRSLGKPKRGTGSKEDSAPMPPAALAYDGSNENHNPFNSLGKVFSGMQ
jgi:hypothetical protein